MPDMHRYFSCKKRVVYVARIIASCLLVVLHNNSILWVNKILQSQEVVKTTLFNTDKLGQCFLIEQNHWWMSHGNACGPNNGLWFTVKSLPEKAGGFYFFVPCHRWDGPWSGPTRWEWACWVPRLWRKWCQQDGESEIAPSHLLRHDLRICLSKRYHG